MLKKIQVKELCEQFEKALIERKYGQDAMYRYRKSMKEFREFTGDIEYSPRHSAEFLTKILGEGFSEKGNKSKVHMYYVRTMRSLEDYYLFGTLLRRHDEMVPMSWPEAFRKTLLEYFFSLEKREITVKGQRREGLLVRDLILYLYRHDVQSFEEMTANHVTGFITSQIGFVPATMAGKISCLRGLLKFLYLEKYISSPLSEGLPKVHSVFRTTVPTVWKPEELQKAKESIDLGNPAGKRDYAIIMLAASTGLRSGDIINLKLSDINWEKKTISITQSKTGEPLILPLMDSTGWALIDYIKNGRPESDFKNVFLRHLSGQKHLLLA